MSQNNNSIDIETRKEIKLLNKNLNKISNALQEVNMNQASIAKTLRYMSEKLVKNLYYRVSITLTLVNKEDEDDFSYKNIILLQKKINTSDENLFNVLNGIYAADGEEEYNEEKYKIITKEVVSIEEIVL